MTFETFKQLMERGLVPGGIDDAALKQAEADVTAMTERCREAEENLRKAEQHERKILTQQNAVNQQAKANNEEFREAKRKALVAIIAGSSEADSLADQAQRLLDKSRWLSDAIQLLAGSLQDEARLAAVEAQADLMHARADKQIAEGVRRSVANWLALKPVIAQDPGITVNSGSMADKAVAEGMSLKVRANEASERAENLRRRLAQAA